MTDQPTASPSRADRRLARRAARAEDGPGLVLVYVASAAALSGMQLIVPAFPAMQSGLGLTNAQIALLVTVYMVPGALASVPSGVLSDRLGRRTLLAWSLVVLGVGGLVITAWPTYGVLLAVRVFQGAAYGVLQTMTVAIIGDFRRGRAQAGAQGMRSVSLTLGEAVLPILGGVLVLWHWRAAVAVQAGCLVLAWLVWRRLPEDRPAALAEGQTAPPRVPMAEVVREPLVVVLVIAGMVRFMLKYAYLTFLPILYTLFHDDNSVAIGLLLAASSLSGTAGALLVRRMLVFLRASVVMIASTALGGVALILISATGQTYVLFVLGAILAGITDSTNGVVQNAMIAVAGRPEARGTTVSLAIGARNVGRFLSPAILGPLSAAVAVTTSVWALGVVAVVFAMGLRPARRGDYLLRD